MQPGAITHNKHMNTKHPAGPNNIMRNINEKIYEIENISDEENNMD